MDAIDDGEIKTGGVSNYGVKHIKELLATKPRIKPAVNQVEVHPFNTQQEIVDFCKANDIIVEAYAPLARAMRMRDPTVTSLSKKYSCSPAQLLVRWSIQQGYVALPKSRDKTRIASNADIGGFQVEASDMAKLTSLHEGLVTDWDPTDAD
ncbi:hypothetical protein MMC25_001025 [Agyrium rufum]|nr:hypothetical protein [Agyrium rufum]